MEGKHIVLDVLARDIQGNRYNVEMQVRRYNDWGKRGSFYLAKLLADQLVAGEDYTALQAAIGIHLLDFDLFSADDQQEQQALWRFEMRDGLQPDVKLGDELQLNLIELKKADRLGLGDQKLKDWITLFEHWKEDGKMAAVTHESVKKVRGYIRELSADEEARRLAFVRERALRDEASQLKYAQEEGMVKGEAKLLSMQIKMKFGEVPQDVVERLNQASAEQLEEWGIKILTADSLDDLMAE